MEPLCVTVNLLEVIKGISREVSFCCLNRNSFLKFDYFGSDYRFTLVAGLSASCSVEKEQCVSPGC